MSARILIVDDAAFMRMLLKDILEKGEYEIAGEAKSGTEAIQKYKDLKPDAVTMDITMPDMDGIQAVKGIKAIDPDAKIIMCSVMGQKEMVVEAMMAGAQDFILKPIQAERILETLEKALNGVKQ